MFAFFLMFYIFANMILINLFIAVLLENFDYNIVEETFEVGLVRALPYSYSRAVLFYRRRQCQPV